MNDQKPETRPWLRLCLAFVTMGATSATADTPALPTLYVPEIRFTGPDVKPNTSQSAPAVVILPLTASGYQIKLRVEPSQERWLTPPNSQLPKDYHDFSVIFVEVTDAQGRLVDGLPVTFRLPSDWESYASLSQPQTVTQNGVARVVLDPLTTGIIRMMTQVDDATREAVFLVQSRSGPGSGGRGTRFGVGMPESRWSYDKCIRLAMQDVSSKTLFDNPEDNP